MKTKELLSKCCKQPLMVSTGDEGTSFYVCMECYNASDPFVEDEKERKCECHCRCEVTGGTGFTCNVCHKPAWFEEPHPDTPPQKGVGSSGSYTVAGRSDGSSRGSGYNPKCNCSSCQMQKHGGTTVNYVHTPLQKTEWEEELKLYLTSAGDRRRTIHFISKLLIDQRREIIEEIEKEMNTYKCDYNWDFSAPRGGKAKKTSYIALKEIFKILNKLSPPTGGTTKEEGK